MQRVWCLQVDKFYLLSLLDIWVLVLEFIFPNEVVIEEGSSYMDGCPFTIDLSWVSIFFKVVNSSGECDKFLSLLSCLCSDTIDK